MSERATAMTRPVFRRTPVSPGHTSVMRNANSSAAWSKSSLDNATSHSERGTRRLLSSATAGRSQPGSRSASRSVYDARESPASPLLRTRSSDAAFLADAYAAAARTRGGRPGSPSSSFKPEGSRTRSGSPSGSESYP